jgi:hypothetical protein
MQKLLSVTLYTNGTDWFATHSTTPGGLIVSQTESVAVGAGSPNTTSGTFGDIGETSGFPIWNVNPGAGRYTRWFALKGAYGNGAKAKAEFQLVVDGVSIASQPVLRVPLGNLAYGTLSDR